MGRLAMSDERMPGRRRTLIAPAFYRWWAIRKHHSFPTWEMLSEPRIRCRGSGLDQRSILLEDAAPVDCDAE
jgi:hypothetical protein